MLEVQQWRYINECPYTGQCCRFKKERIKKWNDKNLIIYHLNQTFEIVFKCRGKISTSLTQ